MRSVDRNVVMRLIHVLVSDDGCIKSSTKFRKCNTEFCITVEPGYNDIGLYVTSLIVSAINSSLLTITLNSSFVTTQTMKSLL